MRVDKHNSDGGDATLTAGAWSGWASGRVGAGGGAGVDLGVDSGSWGWKTPWEAPSQASVWTTIGASASIAEGYQFSSMLDTPQGIHSVGYSPAWLRASGAVHAGYGVAPSVTIRWYPSRTQWSRMDCGD